MPLRINHIGKDDDKDRAAIKKDAALMALVNARPAQINNWVDTNVTTIAGARVALKIILRMLAILARREIREWKRLS